MPKAEELPPHEQYIVDVLVNCTSGSSSVPKDRKDVALLLSGLRPCPPGDKGEPLIIPVLLSTLDGISHLRLFMPKDLRSAVARETVWKSVLEVQRRCPDGIPFLDPVENMGITDEKFKALVKVRRAYAVGVGTC
jgi:ATP-dependent RNA helicase DOB1